MVQFMGVGLVNSLFFFISEYCMILKSHGDVLEILVITIALLISIFYLIVKPKIKKLTRKKIRQKPFPEDWENILREKFTLYNKIPDDLKEDLKNKIKIFLHEKRFFGCQDQEITDEIRVLVAAQACLLLLNRKTNFYPKLKTIYIYPTTYFTRQQVNFGSIVVEQTRASLGESWSSGELVLAWDSVAHGAVNMYDGNNVVYHEFTHQLDQEGGAADGSPILKNRTFYASWAQVLGAEYNNLISRKKRGKKTVMNKYGATNPAEFFAVASETFFEKPRQLYKKHPELYAELQSYYQTNPLDWHI